MACAVDRPPLGRIIGSYSPWMTSTGGYELPGDPAVLGSAFNALLEGFCAIWIAGGGEPIGRSLSDDDAIDTLTGLLAHGLHGPEPGLRD
jgi:hypothetical protein